VDEIGSPAEAAAVRGIAQRGVVMVGTAHGTDLSSLMANPDLNSLIGGIHQVTLSDAEAKWVLHLQWLCPMRAWAPRYKTGPLIKLTPKAVVFVFFVQPLACAQHCAHTASAAQQTFQSDSQFRNIFAYSGCLLCAGSVMVAARPVQSARVCLRFPVW